MEANVHEIADRPTASHAVRRAANQSRFGAQFRAPLQLGKRMANVVFTAQVQFAYACATDARERAERASSYIEQSWPATPLRDLLVDVYRAQAATAAAMASDVLARARERCGLAFARI